MNLKVNLRFFFDFSRITCQIFYQRYDEAAQHIVDALVLQDNDDVRGTTTLNEKRGIVSSALWDTLRTTCLHMLRPELITLCDSRDLEGMFRTTEPPFSSCIIFSPFSSRVSQSLPVGTKES